MGIFNDADWQLRNKNMRDAILDCFDDVEFFKGKKILELGAGHGYFGEMFRVLGGELTCVEGRPEHVETGKVIHPNANWICHDLDAGWPFIKHDFDVILHMGVLYHLERPETNLTDVCNSMKPNSILVIETEFIDTDRPDAMFCLRLEGYNLSVRTFGCRPSHGMIVSILEKCNMEFSRVTSNKYDSEFYIYSLPRKNDNHFDRADRQIWFCRKK
jgi:2-polyprenyl-3-methyl-5-hydroxy-6-metoxy-1,4-benzoquinol methylase